MPAEAVLLASYALLLLGLAHGLRALGGRSSSPWASRTLAGHVRATGDVPEPVSTDDWPHNEVPRLYEGVGLTAALAALVLSGAGLAYYHQAAAVIVLLVTLSLSAAMVLRLTRSLRTKVL